MTDKVLSKMQFYKEQQRSDSLPRYFHGSTATSLGETLNPTVDRIYGGDDKAYATGPDAPRGYKSAADYAYMRAVPQMGVKEPHQGQLFAAVHEVAPRSEVRNPSGALNQIASTEPMDVKGVAGWVRTDDLGAQMSLGENRDL